MSGTAGTLTFNGFAVPLFGESTITQQTAGTDILTMQQAAAVATTTGDFLRFKNSAGTTLSFISRAGHVNLRQYTTKPTTQLIKGDMFLLFHGSRPIIGVCASTAGQQVRLIRLRTKTNGRLTA